MYSGRSPEWIRHLDFELIDLACIFLSILIVNLFRGMMGETFYSSIGVYIMIIFMADIVSVFFLHPYVGIIQRGLWVEFTMTFNHISLIYILWVVCMFLLHEANTLPRLSIVLAWAMSVLLVNIVHFLNKARVRKQLKNSQHFREMMIISEEANFAETLKQLTVKHYTNMHIKAAAFPTAVTDDATNELLKEKKIATVIGDEEVVEYLRSHIIDEVIIDRYPIDHESDELVLTLLGMGLIVHICSGQYMNNYPNLTIGHIGERHIITATISKAHTWELQLKRMLDIIGAIVGLLITGVVAIFIVPAIKLADPGPAIFKQKRVGKNGRVFEFYKFRSMYRDAEERKKELMAQNEMSGFMFKLENDPRIIGSEKGPGKGIGNFIRRTSIDELPQFWNVLKGDMSLVGTRPPTVEEFEMYEPHHKIRLCMQPGITGLWQVSGRSQITDFEDVIRLDENYIENWTFGKDIKILLQTVGVVLSGRGSK